MKVVIEINDNEYMGIKEYPNNITSYPVTIHLYDAVRNGTPLESVLEDIKTEITEKIAYQEKRISKLDNTHTYPSPKPRPVEFSVIPRNPQEIALVKRDSIIEGYENALEIIDNYKAESEG